MLASSLPDLVAFDLDDTLAPSKSAVPERMLLALIRLLARTSVAIISGGKFEQFVAQLLTPLEAIATGSDENTLQQLHLLPTCGTRYVCRRQGAWHTLYHEQLSDAERDAALQTLQNEAIRLGFWQQDTWGAVLEDRGSQITFSALGQQAPVTAKERWDPDNTKKQALRAAVAARLPEFEVRCGGTTSIDITRRGIDKAYGMRKLAAHTGIDLHSMLFIGDRIEPGGNDYPVKELGVRCHPVTGWQETARFIERLLR